jgi:hypothetical protein
MATFFNSATNQFEDDGKQLPAAAPILNIPQGRLVAPDGSQDVQVPLGISPNYQRQQASSKDLAMDMQANPQKYPFGQAFTVDTSPRAMAAYKIYQDEQGQSSDRTTGMPGVSRSDLVGMGGQQQQDQFMGFKPSDIDKQVNKMIAPAMAGQKEKLESANMIMQAAALKGVAEGEYYRQAQEINQQVDNDYKQQLEEKKQQYQEQSDKVARIANQVSEAAQINPNRFWADKGTGDKIAAAISIGLGALGGAMQGTGKNAALDIMNRAIDMDLMAQEKNYQQKKDSLGVQQSLLAMYHQQTGDIQASKMLAKADLITNAQYALNSQLAGVQSKEAMAKGKMMQGVMMEEAGKLRYAAQQQIAQRIQTQQMYSGQGDINPVNVPKEERDLLVNVGGRNMMSRSAGAATEVREKVTAIDNYSQSGQELLQLLNQKSSLGAKFPTELNERIKTIATDMATTYSKSKGMGVYDEGTERAVKAIQGDPESFMTGNNIAKIKQSIHSQEQNKQNILKANVFGYKGIK